MSIKITQDNGTTIVDFGPRVAEGPFTNIRRMTKEEEKRSPLWNKIPFVGWIARKIESKTTAK